ncbi:DUF389 domain-containing protein [Halalkalicoccus jeotgali]|uniref:TIGR00341 family protein n=1 Tax=Halalkalicoccus jeotgali (strain DSM 18796 / CECT 7217 / JCM 14584 / KCTC 4019 / B3) TaxID=795797 RepID=D8J7M9_HALJB|nr:DUF389 domain-containing protein [Halalkalicoccus jeotgali]ADJ16049.1 hypothetical protein HacjB3_13340 [Halalkalicoccus jeotgali B3]ELY38145.1 hypothetical protein C497_08544 [Halalkalicoccus jeotgali B3]
MRQVRILVDEDDRETIVDVLEDKDVDYVISGENATGDSVLIEFPLPTDAVGDVLGSLDEAGYEDTYTVISQVESARTPNAETLMERYAGDFDPLTTRELRSKASDMSNDTKSFLALMLLSAWIATAGLLSDSPAIVVGAMVIAPIVGPALTASVGGVVGDREMLAASIRLQAMGLVAAIAGATALAAVIRWGMFAQPDLALGSIELIGVRTAPTLLALIAGTAAGAAAAFGLTTKGPMSLIGVMIAAALIPTAAATGIAIAWRDPVIAAGTALLLVITLVAINLAGAVVLFGLGYRPDRSLLGGSWRSAKTLLAIALLVSVIGLTGVATAEQISHERTVNQVVHAELTEHENVTAVAVRNEYGDLSALTGPETVTVVASYTGGGDPPSDLAADIEERLDERSDRPASVRVRFQEYQTAQDSNGSSGS